MRRIRFLSRLHMYQPRSVEPLESRLLLTQTPLSLFQLTFDVTNSNGENSLSSIYQLGGTFAVVATPYDTSFSVYTRDSSGLEIFHPVSNEFPDQVGGIPGDVVQLHNELYFFLNDDQPMVDWLVPAGQSVFKYSEADGLQQLLQISPLATSQNPDAPFQFQFQDSLYFMADAEVQRNESWMYTAGNFGLWKTDGTVDGTVPVLELIPGLRRTRSTAEANDRLLLSVDTEAGGSLWSFDGTVNGTQRILSGQTSSLVEANDLVYFTVDSELGNGLFVSDGWAAGTRLVADGTSLEFGSNPHDLTAHDDGLLFTTMIDDRKALWFTDAETNTLIANDVRDFIVADQLYFTSETDTTTLYRVTGDTLEDVFTGDASISLLGATEQMLLFESSGSTFSVGEQNESRQALLFETPGEFQQATSQHFVFTSETLELGEIRVDEFEPFVETIYSVHPWISAGTNASTVPLGEPLVVRNWGPPGDTHRLSRIQEVGTNHLAFRIHVEFLNDGLDQISDFTYDMSTVQAPAPGDANEDGRVDFADFLILSANFGRTDAAFADGDFDANGAIDFADFLILSNNFGKS